MGNSVQAKRNFRHLRPLAPNPSAQPRKLDLWMPCFPSQLGTDDFRALKHQVASSLSTFTLGTPPSAAEPQP